MAYNPLQDNEAIFPKKYFSNILDRIFEQFLISIKMPPVPLLTVE